MEILERGEIPPEEPATEVPPPPPQSDSKPKPEPAPEPKPETAAADAQAAETPGKVKPVGGGRRVMPATGGAECVALLGR